MTNNFDIGDKPNGGYMLAIVSAFGISTSRCFASIADGRCIFISTRVGRIHCHGRAARTMRPPGK